MTQPPSALFRCRTAEHPIDRELRTLRNTFVKYMDGFSQAFAMELKTRGPLDPRMVMLEVLKQLTEGETVAVIHDTAPRERIYMALETHVDEETDVNLRKEHLIVDEIIPYLIDRGLEDDQTEAVLAWATYVANNFLEAHCIPYAQFWEVKDETIAFVNRFLFDHRHRFPVSLGDTNQGEDVQIVEYIRYHVRVVPGTEGALIDALGNNTGKYMLAFL